MSAALFLPTCREVTGLLSDYLEGELPWRKGLGIRLHLGMCPACQRFLESLRQMPGFLKQVLDPEAIGQGADALARRALDAAMVRIGGPRRREPSLSARVPEAFTATLAAGAASPCLRVLAEAQHRVQDAGVAAGPWFLPGEILAQLPPPATWERLRPGPGGSTVYRLLQEGGTRLFLMGLGPGRRFPAHVHLARESILLVQGGLEDGDRRYAPGDWAVHEAGSAHAPRADAQGCWALVRLEGKVRFTGWRRLLPLPY